MAPPPTPSVSLPRADTPRASGQPGWFPWASASLRGLPLPFWTLQGYLLLMFSAIDEHWEATFAKFRPRMALGVLTLLLVFGGIVTGKTTLGRILESKPARWLVVFFGAVVASSLWAFDGGLAQTYAIDYLTSILSFFLIVAVVHTRRELLLTILTIALGSGLFLALSVYEWRSGRYEYTQGVIRMLGAGTAHADPNSFGATLAFLFPLMLWVGTSARSKLVRLGAALFALLALYSVQKTSSRSAMMLTVLTGIWAFFYLPTRRARIAYLGVAAVGVVVVLSMMSTSQTERILSIFSSRTYTKEESTHGRVQGYLVAVDMLKDRPVLGVGPGNWSAYRSRRIDGSKLLPHNLLGQIAGTQGLLGLVGFFGYLFAVFAIGLSMWRRWRLSRVPWDQGRSRFAHAVLFAYFLLLVSGLGAHNAGRPNWFWMGGLLVAALTAKHEDEDEPRSTRVADRLQAAPPPPARPRDASRA